MARYNREFLVPYLHNICALHLAIEKINRKINELNEEVGRMKQGVYAPCPSDPVYKTEYSFGKIVTLLLGVFLLIACASTSRALLSGGDPSWGLFLLVLLLEGGFGVLFILIAVVGIQDVKEENERKRREYYERLERYERAKKENERMRRLVSDVEEKRAAWVAERNRVNCLLQQAYAVNIIPKYYRDLYPAVYLYDWFSTAQEDDVAMALNMFVLEEIKAKLDRIISNQSEIILNQYIQEANQRRAMEQRDDHQRQLMSKLDRISAQDEERNHYLRMIASTSAADAYFSAANYLRNL